MKMGNVDLALFILFFSQLVTTIPLSEIQQVYPQICLTTADCPALNQECSRNLDQGYGYCMIRNNTIESPAAHEMDHSYVVIDKNKPGPDDPKQVQKHSVPSDTNNEIGPQDDDDYENDDDYDEEEDYDDDDHDNDDEC